CTFHRGSIDHASLGRYVVTGAGGLFTGVASVTAARSPSTVRSRSTIAAARSGSSTSAKCEGPAPDSPTVVAPAARITAGSSGRAGCRAERGRANAVGGSESGNAVGAVRRSLANRNTASPLEKSPGSGAAYRVSVLRGIANRGETTTSHTSG